MLKVETEDQTLEKEEKSSWIKIKRAELEKIIIELAKDGNTPANIGLILRDKYSIPKTKILGKKVTRVLKEANIRYKAEKDIVSKKVEKLKSHIEKNKYDQSAKRSLAKKLWLLYALNKK